MERMNFAWKIQGATENRIEDNVNCDNMSKG